MYPFLAQTPFNLDTLPLSPLCYYIDNKKKTSVNYHVTLILYIQKIKGDYHMNYAFIGIDE